MKVAKLNSPLMPTPLRSPKGPDEGPPVRDHFQISSSRAFTALTMGAVGMVGGMAVGRTLATPGVLDVAKLLEVSLRPESLLEVAGGLAGFAVLAAGAYHLTSKKTDEAKDLNPSPALRMWSANAAAMGLITGGVGGAALLGALGQATGLPQVGALAIGVGAGLGATAGAAGGYRIFS